MSSDTCSEFVEFTESMVQNEERQSHVSQMSFILVDSSVDEIKKNFSSTRHLEANTIDVIHKNNVVSLVRVKLKMIKNTSDNITLRTLCNDLIVHH